MDHQVEHDADVFATAIGRARASAHGFDALGLFGNVEQAHGGEHQAFLVADLQHEVLVDRKPGEIGGFFAREGQRLFDQRVLARHQRLASEHGMRGSRRGDDQRVAGGGERFE